jgi:ABC-type transport system substrate-binding protein
MPLSHNTRITECGAASSRFRNGPGEGTGPTWQVGRAVPSAPANCVPGSLSRSPLCNSVGRAPPRGARDVFHQTTSPALRPLLPRWLGMVLWAALLLLLPSMTLARPRVLRIAYTEDPKTLDPTLVMEESNFELMTLLFLPLLDNSNLTNTFPCGARSWSVSPDWRTFEFKLRPEVRFSNGRRVVAADYAYTLERIVDSKTGSMNQGYLLGIQGAAEVKSGATNHLRGIHAPDPDTLVIELDKPDLTFPYAIASFAMAMPQEIATKDAAEYARNPACTGPYKVARFKRGNCLSLVPNPYYGGPEPIHFDRIEVRLTLDEATQMMMFERGELDFIRVPFSQLKRTAQEPGLRQRRDRTQLLNTFFLAMNTEMPPLNDVRIRQAISYAIDRKRRVFERTGWGVVAKGMIPPAMPGYDPDLRGYDYDLPKARALMAQAKPPTPLRLACWYAVTSPFMAALAQGVAADLAEIGIELELNGVTQPVLDEATSHRGRVALALNGWNVSLPDPKDCLGTQFDGRLIEDISLLNTSFYNNPEVNRLLDEASASTDLATRFARYRTVERLVLADAPYAFLYHRQLFVLRQPWVKGPLLDPLWWVRFDRVFLN